MGPSWFFSLSEAAIRGLSMRGDSPGRSIDARTSLFGRELDLANSDIGAHHAHLDACAGHEPR